MTEANFLFIGLVAFFLPLAAYCLVLAMVNRRINPAMICGSWDTMGLLLACSGGLLVCGPGVIYVHFNRMSIYQGIDKDEDGNPVKKGQPDKKEPEPLPWKLWWVMAWAGYYLLVLSIAALLILGRRDKTIVYNVDADLFDAVLDRVLEKCNLGEERVGRTVFIGPRQAQPVHTMDGPAVEPIAEGADLTD